MTQGAAEDLWHLSIDDLFVKPVETPPLEGPGPFVINLSASTAPIGIPATGVSGFEKLKLYQLSRKEDGRDRFRLRLGFFDTPAAANEALAALRERYPSAFATNATDDDQRFNPARPRPPKAEPVVVAAAQNSSGHAHARNAVRSDSGRRGKKKDVRRDHAAHPRGTETHGAQRNKQASRNGHVHGPAKSALHLAQVGVIKEESIDVESILLAALAPAASDKPSSAPSKPQPAPGKTHQQDNARHAGKPGHGSKHSRVHSRPSEAKHQVSRHVAKSNAPAPAVVAPPVVSPAASQPVAATPEIAPSIPAPGPSPLEALQPTTKSPTLLVPPPVLVEAVLPVPSGAPERIEAAADADNEANIVTHPRLDEAPAANSEPPGADIPIDLHFIDRIFDDDTPTVEVLALESSDALPAVQEEPKQIVEPVAAKRESAPAAEPESKVSAKQPPAASEAPAISAHDIIALLTQPISDVRASQSKRTSRPAVPEPQTPASVAPPAAPSVQAAAETPSVDCTSPISKTAEAEPETRTAAAPSPQIEEEIPTLTQIATAASPLSVPEPVEAEEISSPTLAAQTRAEADASVGAIAAGIESELELILPADGPAVDAPPAPSAESAFKIDEAPTAGAPIELELELVPEEPSAPALSDVFEEVIVAQVIPARREPPVAKSQTSVPPTASATHTAPVPPAPVSVTAAQLPAESIFKVKNRPARTTTAPPRAPAAPAMKRPVVIFDAPIEDMDSTQTLRALTPLELNDDSQSKWFAVQLALSEEPVKVESLPHIDIFDEYRLYSISGIDQGRFLHSLRMGFFSAESSAQAVAGYLRASFEDAVVKRVSIAEHDRFAERKAKPEKKVESETVAARAPEARRSDVQPAAASSSTTPARSTGPIPKVARKPRSSVDSAPTGRHRTLGEQLYDEAREVALSQSAIRRLPKNSSLWSRLFGQDKDKP